MMYARKLKTTSTPDNQKLKRVCGLRVAEYAVRSCNKMRELAIDHYLGEVLLARPVNVTRTRMSESRKQPAKIPERQPREQGETGCNAGSIVLAGSGIARSMDSAAREQLAARRTRCASAAVCERSGSRDQGCVACRRRRSGVDQDHKAQWWWRAWPESTCQSPRSHLSQSRS